MKLVVVLLSFIACAACGEAAPPPSAPSTGAPTVPASADAAPAPTTPTGAEASTASPSPTTTATTSAPTEHASGAPCPPGYEREGSECVKTKSAIAPPQRSH